MSGVPEIVVGVDGSEPSTRALIWALGTAASRDWKVGVVTAWPDADAVWVHDVPGHFSAPRRHAIELQEAALAEARRTVTADPAVEQHIVNARPVDALHARARSARLVVVGTHGIRHSRGRASLGEALTRLVACPVVVIDGFETATEA